MSRINTGLTVLLLFSLLCLPVVAQDQEIPQTVISGSMCLGISWYPERRPPDLWEHDIQMMVNAGIKRVRMAEFAWSAIEPSEGDYQWEWLYKAINLAATHDLEVVLCTPTATPPIWLIEKHPEILPVDSKGRRTVFGARQHRCYNVPAYQEATVRLVTEMAKRFGKHPAVVAWQLDNEFGGEQKRCYCNHCAEAFQAFLTSKYMDIDSLNNRWGNAFWSIDYQRFDQINPPLEYTGTLLLKHHPSLELEYSRFASGSIIAYADLQTKILREHIDDAPITTNRFSYEWGDNLDSYALVAAHDIASFDLYSDEEHEIAFYADLNYSLKPGNSWIMEYSPRSLELTREMELMQQRGVDWLFFFKLNPFPAGQEQGQVSLMTITGEPSTNYTVVKNWSQTVPEPPPPLSRTGLYYDFECSWVHFHSIWGKYRERLVYQDYQINTVYRALFHPGKRIRFFFRSQDIRDIDTLILPMQILWDPELENALIRFVQDGGTLITTSDLFHKNRDNVYLTELPPFYGKVLRFSTNDFIYGDGHEETPVIAGFGKGKVIMISRRADLDEWKQYIYNK